MAKRILVDPHVSSQMQAFVDQDKFSYGLVLGHFTGKELMVIHLARAPLEESEENADEIEDEQEEKGPRSMTEVDPQWVLEHAKQVRAMLPGGMDIQGLFVSTKDDLFKKHEAKIATCLRLIKQSFAMDEPLLWPVFHLDKKSIQLKVLSLTEPNKSKMSGFEETEMTWFCLKANLILDQSLAFTEEKTDCPFKDKLAAAVFKLQKSLDNAKMLINGELKQESDLLDKKQQKSNKKSSTKGRKNHHQSETDQSCDELEFNERGLKEFNVDILLDDVISDDCIVSDVKSRMHLTGRMSARAFVHQSSTVDQGLLALKTDILRSFKARLDLHCDSLVGDDMRGTDNDDIPILHEPPRRVNIKLPSSPISVSDFLFPGETQEESVKAVEEMLGFTPHFEHLDDELEIVASPQTMRVRLLPILACKPLSFHSFSDG